VATGLLSSLLGGIRPIDLVTFAGVVLLLGAVALLASYIPARRAVKVDPMVALRVEGCVLVSILRWFRDSISNSKGAFA